MDKKSQIKRCGLAYICCFFLMLCACQKTPDQDIVANKGDDTLQERIHATAAPRQVFEAPATWNGEYYALDPTLTLLVDASIEVPQTDSFTVLSVEPRIIDQDFVNHTVHVVTQNNALYEVKKQEDLTKEEIEAEIIALKSGQDSDFYHYDKDMYCEQVQPLIAALQNQYAACSGAGYLCAQKIRRKAETATSYRESRRNRFRRSGHIDVRG